MQEVDIQRYSSQFTNEWNNFVAASKNTTFLFNRSYMDYHSDRFKDHSLLIRLDGKLSAVFVANEKEERIESHGGLTYGGLVLDPGVGLPEVIQMFKAIVKYYHELGFRKIIYKCVPAYLHLIPANEDQFVLFALDAELIRRDTSSVIVNDQRLSYQSRRNRGINKARKENFTITESNDCSRFWNEVLTPNLRDRYETEPVHTSQEMDLLLSRFPNNIMLYEVVGSEIAAGIVAYIYEDCVHAQYISSTEAGRDHGALDLLVDHLITKFSGKKYFSLGTSNNEGGPGLNSGVVTWKEGFGARTFVHDFYEIDTGKFKLLERYE
ncbi:MAG: GNAT family N-acetyltransferase [Bacteroidota bacterium]